MASNFKEDISLVSDSVGVGRPERSDTSFPTNPTPTPTFTPPWQTFMAIIWGFPFLVLEVIMHQ